MNIALIYPPPLYVKKYLAIPLGIAQIKRSLEESGYTTQLIDSNSVVFENPELFSHLFSKITAESIKSYIRSGHDTYIDLLCDHFLRKIKNTARLIGISIMGYGEFKFAICLAKRIKKLSKTRKVVLGGSFLTLNNHIILDDFDFIDYVIHGPGEQSLALLIKKLNNGSSELASIPGLIFKKNGKVVINQCDSARKMIKSLPDFSGFSLELYRRMNNGVLTLPYFVGEGCNNKCAFCMVCQLTKTVGYISPLKIVNDLKKIKHEHNTRSFDLLCDSIVNNNNGFLHDLCRAIIKKRLKINWESGASANYLKDVSFSLLSRSGCTGLRIGIETASPRLLKMIKKPVPIPQLTDIFKNMRRNNIKIGLNLIAGLPMEKTNDFSATCDFIKINSKYISSVCVTPFMLYKATSIFAQPHKYGIQQISNMEERWFGKYCPHYLYDAEGYKFSTLQKIAIKKTAILENICNNIGIDVLNKKTLE